MSTKSHQKLLIMATALVVIAGLLMIPAIAHQHGDATSYGEKLQKAQEKRQNATEKYEEKMNNSTGQIEIQ